MCHVSLANTGDLPAVGGRGEEGSVVYWETEKTAGCHIKFTAPHPLLSWTVLKDNVCRIKQNSSACSLLYTGLLPSSV